MTPLPLDAVIFDLDGTLLDTVPLIVESHQAALRDGFDDLAKDVPFLISTIGLPLEFVYNEARLGPTWRTRLARFFDVNMSRSRVATGVCLGVGPLLVDLKARGFGVGVATAKRHAHAAMALDWFGLTSNIDVLIGKEDTATHKPDPAPLIEAARRLGVEPGATLYVGDSVYDIEAAHRGGFFSAAVAWSYTPKDTLLATHPTLWIERAEALSAAVVRRQCRKP